MAWFAAQVVIRYHFNAPPEFQRYMFIMGSFLVVFFPFGEQGLKKYGNSLSKKILEYGLFGASLVLGGIILQNAARYSERWMYVDDVYAIDIVGMIIVVLLMLEGTRRLTGMALPIFIAVMLAYGFAGPYLPGIFGHAGMSFSDMAEVQLMGNVGTFGIAAGVCVDFVFYFVAFGALYEAFGGSELLNQLGMLGTRKSVGGPAKSAIVCSSLMGSISGSAVANVVATGTFTIPLMKKSGVSPTVAGAVEATASTGGQILPPIMGAGAFIMAEMLGMRYLDVCKAAALPAILYYVAIFAFVHFYSKKNSLGTSESLFTISKEDILGRLHMVIPLALLVYLIVSGRSVGLSALYSVLSLMVIGCLFKRTRPTFGQFVNAMSSSMKQSASVAIPIFICGIAIGVAIHTGIAMKATNVVVNLGQDQLLLSLLLGVLVTIILGMGLPTSAAYVVASLFVAPALAKCGISPIAAHMFIFYYAVLGQLTPPVAVTAYTAAGISGSNPIRTSWIAFGMAMPAFLIPFAFVYNPALLLVGSNADIIQVTATTFIGCMFLAYSLSGYSLAPEGSYGNKQKRAFQATLIAAAMLLIDTGSFTDLIGLGAGFAVVGYDYWLSKQPHTPAAKESANV